MKSKILLIDDSEAYRSTLAETLSDSYQILEAADAGEGRRLIDANADLGLAILDERLPDIPGSRLAGEILKTRPELSILLMSGFDKEHLSFQLPDSPNIDYLMKTGDIPALLSKVNSLMSGKN